MTRPSSASEIALSDTLRAAARCVQQVLAGRSLSDSLARVPMPLRPAVQAISFFTMRRLGYARAVSNHLVSRPPAHDLFNALLLTALALADAAVVSSQRGSTGPEYDSAPLYSLHTLVDQAVECARQALRPWRGLLNGVLRRFIREHAEIDARVRRDEEAVWNYPQWWIDRIRQASPDQWQAVLMAGNVAPPMFLRVNTRRTQVRTVLEQFAAAGVEAQKVSDQAIRLVRPAPVDTLPGFSQGWWSVQDISAQRAGLLWPITDGMRVLDACAAPGGKTAHLLELADLEMLALDIDSRRLEQVAQNLARLGLHNERVKLQCADAADLSSWWDGQPFDAVLADVPCTASGVVRRHPDIRWLRRPGDISAMARLQSRLIDALWETVAPGGHFLYVTCSVFAEEGEQQARAFEQRHADARRLPAPGQVWPLYHEGIAATGDGFFYALFCRN